jgi:Protein of unknown function (DUF2934)
MINKLKPMKDEIASRAYELYLQRGCEHGRDVEDWAKASKELSENPSVDPGVPESPQEAASHNADLRSAWPE